MNIRVEHIFTEEMSGDTSFKNDNSMLSVLFGGVKYSSKEAKEIWDSGIKHGIEIGLNRANIEGQIIELRKNTSSDKHNLFIKEFLELSNKYNCAIQYHPKVGMVVVDKSKK